MKKRYGMVIDLERCTGCRACTVACKIENSMEHCTGIRVETVGGAWPDTPAGEYPKLSMRFLPIACMHCERPPCRDACPTQAIYQRPDGAVLIDDSLCNGCQECLAACPYDALVYDEDKALVRKCTLCSARLDQGLEPFCSKCCGYGAITFGDMGDPRSIVSKLATRSDAYALKPESKTGPAVIYLPAKASRGFQHGRRVSHR